MAQPNLSPYDTGARAEPKVWLPYGTSVTEATPAENFGKVDFDDDEGHTICVAHVAREADGTHVLYVESMVDSDGLRVELYGDKVLVVLQPKTE